MVFQFTTTTGPQQVSSSSRTTTVRTTQTTSGASRPLLTTGLGPSLLPSSSAHTTTQYVTSGVPMVTQTRYATTAPIITTGPVVTTTTTGGSAFATPSFIKPPIMTYPTQTLGTLSMTPFRPMYTSTLATSGAAPMGLATGPVSTSVQTSASSQVTYSNSASLTINGVRCEGYIAVANDRIVEGKNLFVGTAPFVLSQETLEVTPELTVVARNPDIKYHLGDLPNAQHESLTLAELRKLAEIDEGAQIWIGLPGQAASLVTDSQGSIQFLQQTTPTLAPSLTPTLMPTLMPTLHH